LPNTIFPETPRLLLRLACNANKPGKFLYYLKD